MSTQNANSGGLKTGGGTGATVCIAQLDYVVSANTQTAVSYTLGVYIYCIQYGYTTSGVLSSQLSSSGQTTRSTSGGDCSLSAGQRAKLSGNWVYTFPKKQTAYTQRIYFQVTSTGNTVRGTSSGYLDVTIPALASYQVSYNANGGTGTINPDIKYYGINLPLSDGNNFNRNNYTLTRWNTSADDTGTVYALSATYTANSPLTLYAQWKANAYTVSFDGNGDTQDIMPSSVVVQFDSTFVFPTVNTTEYEQLGYIFLGWSANPTAEEPQYLPGDSIIWKNGSDVTYYAIWHYAPISIYYCENISENNFDKPGAYIKYKTVRVNPNDSYELTNVLIPNLNNYNFSGYWLKDKPNDTKYTEFGISFPTGVLPHNYEKYLSDKNFLTEGSIIEDIKTDIYLYPVYIDNTPSVISKLYSSYEYVPSGVTQQEYYLYITNQITYMQTSLSNENVVMCVSFRTSAGNNEVSLDISNISYTLKSDSDTPINVDLNPVLYKSSYNADLNTQDFYLIFKTTSQQGGVLIDYDNTSYILTISGIKDSFEKNLEDVVLIILPPKIIRDVNYNGDVVSFFDEAVDYTDEEKLIHTEDELWINGLAICNNFLLQDEPVDPETGYGPYATQLLDTGNITSEDMDSLYTFSTIDLSKLLLYILSKL